MQDTAAHNLVTEVRYTWVGASRPPKWSRSHHFDFLKAHGLEWESCSLSWDVTKAKKKVEGRRSDKDTLSSRHKDQKATGRCAKSNVSVIDIDDATAEAATLIQVLNGRCNLVARTPKGIHFFFAHCAELPTAYADEVSKVDVRSGGSDIIFVAPSAYKIGATTAEYKWLAIPHVGTKIASCPAEVVNLVSEMVAAKRDRQGTTRHAHTGPREDKATVDRAAVGKAAEEGTVTTTTKSPSIRAVGDAADNAASVAADPAKQPILPPASPCRESSTDTLNILAELQNMAMPVQGKSGMGSAAPLSRGPLISANTTAKTTVDEVAVYKAAPAATGPQDPSERSCPIPGCRKTFGAKKAWNPWQAYHTHIVQHVKKGAHVSFLQAITADGLVGCDVCGKVTKAAHPMCGRPIKCEATAGDAPDSTRKPSMYYLPGADEGAFPDLSTDTGLEHDETAPPKHDGVNMPNTDTSSTAPPPQRSTETPSMAAHQAPSLVSKGIQNLIGFWARWRRNSTLEDSERIALIEESANASVDPMALLSDQPHIAVGVLPIHNPMLDVNNSRCPTCHYSHYSVKALARHRLADHLNHSHQHTKWTAMELSVIKDQHVTWCTKCAQWHQGSQLQHAGQCAKTLARREAIEAEANQFATEGSPAPSGREFPSRPTLDEFFNTKKRTVRSLEPANRPMWTSRCRGDILARMTHAPLQERLLCHEAFITLPQRALPVPEKKKNKEQRRRFTAATIRGDIGGDPPKADTAITPAKTEDEDAHAVQRANVFSRMGNFGKACRALNDTATMAPKTEDVAKKLQDLHPEEGHAMPTPPCQARITVLMDTVRFVVKRKMARASSPGLDGWTRELLEPLVDDAVCLRGLAMMVEDLINGEATPWTRAVLSACELLPFNKPNGAIRPIAPESALAKLVALVAMSLCREAITKVLAKSQFGVGRPGGPEAGAHHIRKAVEKYGMDVALDMDNAYNCMWRHKSLEKLYATETLRPLWGVTELMYGQPGVNIIYNDEGRCMRRVKSTRGFRQGSVLAALLFSLAIDDVLRKLETECGEDGVTAYIDDIHFSCPWEKLDAIYEWVRADLEALGLTINTSKSELFAGRKAPLRYAKQCVELLRILGSVVGRDEDDTGSPLSNSADSMKAFCMAVARKHERLFRLLSHPQISTNTAIKVLLKSGLPRMNFLVRTTPRSIVAAAVDAFDDMLMRAAVRIHGEDAFASANALSLLIQPLRDGGNGARPVNVILPHAYICSRDEQGERTQRIKTAIIERAAFDMLELTPTEKVATLSTSGARGSSAMTSTHNEAICAMSDESMRAMARMRLDADPIEDMRKMCKCNDNAPARHHAMCCPKTKGDAKRRRHDGIKNVLILALSAAGFQVEPEPQYYSEGSAKRPDIIVRIGSTTYAVEVSVVHPYAAAYRAAALLRQGAAAQIRTAEKQRKYLAICAAKKPQPHTLVVCAVETYGLVSEDFLRFMKMAESASRRSSLAMDGWADRTLLEVSAALHEGNLEVWRKYMAYEA